jgi:hypothetical protein
MRTRLPPDHALAVAQVAHAHLVEKAAVDLLDDLQMPGQDGAEQVQRPGFQRFRQQGVVGVGEALPGELPGRLPGQQVLVDQ